MTDCELIARARSVTGSRSQGTVEVGTVGAALLSPEGEVFLGASMDAACGVGFCAEQAAVGALVTAGRSRVVAMVAVRADGTVLPPCGRCRELVRQIDGGNQATRVILTGGRSEALGGLLTAWWIVEATAS